MSIRSRNLLVVLIMLAQALVFFMSTPSLDATPIMTGGGGAVVFTWTTPRGCPTTQEMADTVRPQALQSLSPEHLRFRAQIDRRHKHHWRLLLRIGAEIPGATAKKPTLLTIREEARACEELALVTVDHLISRLQRYPVRPAFLPAPHAPARSVLDLQLLIGPYMAGLWTTMGLWHLGGGQVLIGVKRRALSLEIGAAAGAGSGSWNDARVQARMFVGTVRGCVSLGRTTLSFPLCIGLDAGGLFATIDGRRHPGAGLLVPHATGGVLWRVHRRVGVKLQAMAGPALVDLSAERMLGGEATTEVAGRSKVLFGATLGLTIFLDRSDGTAADPERTR